jgi:hypothetical protein
MLEVPPEAMHGTRGADDHATRLPIALGIHHLGRQIVVEYARADNNREIDYGKLR